MIRETRQIKCLIAQAPGGHTPPLPEVNFIMVEIPTRKPYISMIKVNRQIKCPKSWGPGSSPSTTGSFFENYTYLWNHFVNFNQTLPKCSLGDPFPKLCFCLVTLIINIYGLGVGISTIKKFTSDRGWGIWPWGLSYYAFNLPSHPNHKYIWFRAGSSPSTTGSFFENYTYLWNHFVNFNQTLPKCSLGDPFPKLCSHTNIDASVGIQEAYWTDHKLVWLQIPF
jgi:hypothetical protein